MRTSVSGNSVKSFFNKRIKAKSSIEKGLRKDSSILKDVGQIAGFASCIIVGEPITIGYAISTISKTAGSLLSLCTTTIDRFNEKDQEIEDLFEYDHDKFNIFYYVLLQRSYFHAIEETFKKYELFQIDDTRFKPKKINKNFVQKLKLAIQKIDFAEVRYQLSVEPKSINNPLYEVYSAWLEKIFDQAGYEEDRSVKIIASIDKQAREHFNKKLCEDTPLTNWIRNYLLLDHQIDSSKEIMEHLAGIQERLDNWLDVQDDPDNIYQEAWIEYREKLKAKPDNKDSMFNETFGVRQVFVCPEVNYYKKDFKENPIKSKRDLSTILGGLLSKRTSNEDLIFLCGGPGSGKSTLCRLLCDQLAQNRDVFPVLLRLRKLKECSNVAGYIEEALKGEKLIGELSDLRSLKNVVIVLDGFDEVIMANKSKLKTLFACLQHEVKRYSFRETKIIIAGRDTLFPNGEGIPDHSHVLELLPFNEARGARWGKKWNQIKNNDIDGTEFKPEIHFSSGDKEERKALHQLVSWPLTLHLVARVHDRGFINLSENTSIEKAFIYKCILYDTSLRQDTRMWNECDIGRFDPETMHNFLMEIAWQMHLEGTEIIEKNKIGEVLGKFLEKHCMDDLKAMTETVILNTPEFKKGEDKEVEDTGIEFVHKSFGEYLAAEAIAKKLETVHEQATLVATGERKFTADENKVIEILSEIYCIRAITEEIFEFLASFVGTYTEYDRKPQNLKRYINQQHNERIIRMIQRIVERYCHAPSSEDTPIILRYIKDQKLESNVNYLTCVYTIGILKTLAILHRRLKKKFYIYENLKDPIQLHAICATQGKTIKKEITKYKNDLTYFIQNKNNKLNKNEIFALSIREQRYLRERGIIQHIHKDHILHIDEGYAEGYEFEKKIKYIVKICTMFDEDIFRTRNGNKDQVKRIKTIFKELDRGIRAVVVSFDIIIKIAQMDKFETNRFTLIEHLKKLRKTLKKVGHELEIIGYKGIKLEMLEKIVVVIGTVKYQETAVALEAWVAAMVRGAVAMTEECLLDLVALKDNEEKKAEESA